MRAALLDRCRQRQQLVGADVGQRAYVDHRWPALGQRTGLVHRQYPHPLGQLERLGIPDQHAMARPLASTDHDRGRRRQAERTRAGDHQHRNRIDQGLLQLGAGQQPAAEGQQRDRDYGRYEDRRYPVGKPLNRRLRALRLLDHADDAGQHGLTADAGRTAVQQATAIDRRSKDWVALAFCDRQALAGQHRFVQPGFPVDDLAVDRNGVARPHDEVAARRQPGDRHLLQPPFPLDPGGRRLQTQQCFDRRAGACLGPGLEQLAKQDQRDDRRRRLEVHMMVRQARRGHHRTEQPGDAGAEGDQDVHVGRAAPERRPGATIEAPADPELDRRRQHHLQPTRDQVVTGPGPQQAEHRRHLGKQRQRQGGGNPEPAQLVTIGRFAPRLVGVVCDIADFARAEPGGLHRRDQGRHRIDARRVADVGTLGREIDVGADARPTVQYLLQSGRTGGAGHALDRQFDLLFGYVVACLTDAVDHLRRVGIDAQLDVGIFGRQIDVRADAGKAVEHPLDTCGTGGAGHAGDR